jgi:hypothetical protein
MSCDADDKAVERHVMVWLHRSQSLRQRIPRGRGITAVVVVSEAPQAPSGCRCRSRTKVRRKGSDLSTAPGPLNGRGRDGSPEADPSPSTFPAAPRETHPPVQSPEGVRHPTVSEVRLLHPFRVL